MPLNLSRCFGGVVTFLSLHPANTVSLLAVGAVGAVAITALVRAHSLAAFIKRGAFRVALCTALLIVITVYHWRTTDIPHLFSADSVCVLFYTKQYLSFITNTAAFAPAVLWILSIAFCAAFIYSIIAAKGKHCELSCSLVIHTALMFVIPILGRGTLTERLLIPSYPLVVMGITEILTNCYGGIKHYPLPRRLFQAMGVLFASVMLVNFVHCTDLSVTVRNPWDEGIRARYRHGERAPQDDGVWHTCVWEFYENQDKYLEPYNGY